MKQYLVLEIKTNDKLCSVECPWLMDCGDGYRDCAILSRDPRYAPTYDETGWPKCQCKPMKGLLLQVCPKCGTHEITLGMYLEGHWYISCYNCGLIIEAPTQAKVIRKWNTIKKQTIAKKRK